MTDTACPSCDAPAPAGARRCSRCGYRFLEDAGPVRRPHPPLKSVALTAAAVAAVAVAAVLVAGADGGGADENDARGDAPSAHLDVLSDHPLTTSVAARLLERRFIGVRDDESAFVSCSGRIPKPAHSVRRCHLHYPGGIQRRIVLLTTANGAEVLGEP
jgi:ribosomal protein L40E